MAEHNLLGRKGEMLASRYLMDKGFAILHYNWRSGHKEIDIIAKERDTLVFVEVKSRSSELYGNAEQAVDDKKIRLLLSAAQTYILKYGIDLKYRFDIITVIGVCEPYRIEHIRDAFYATW
ncbi:MAG: YraN family protein [Bacteroidaceae bacterium]|nr:YraN family protein [Bacteroidaceae bacterium]